MTLMSDINLLKNSHKQDTGTLTNQGKSLKFGTVTAYDPNVYAVQVTFEPYDQSQIPETQWVPIVTGHAGLNRGIFTPPKVGDEAVVAFGDGAFQNGAVIGYMFNNEDRPVLVTSGNFLIQIGDGTDLSTISIGENGELTISSSQTVTITAPSVTIGADGGSSDFLAKFTQLKTEFDAHTHPTPSGESSPPTQPLSNDVATTATQAN
jgi:phage baseplate assembly protein gpV